MISIDIYKSIEEIDQEIIAQWSELEKRALTSNAYLSPSFIIPAIKYLTPDSSIVIIIVSDVTDNNSVILGVGVFEIIKPTLRYPFTYLRTYRSEHSFIGGMLLDDKKYREVLYNILTYLKNEKKYSALQFSDVSLFTELSDSNNELCKKSIHWFNFENIDRLILIPKNSGIEYLEKNMSKRSYKNIKRKKRKLNELGDVEWVLISKNNITSKNSETFLKLERSGWKGDVGSTLSKSSESEMFFKEMISNFKKYNDIFFTEIKLNGKSIASTCNLISGNVGFAFKLAWDANYSKYSIGVLNEVDLVSHAPELLGHLDYIDGGTNKGSFLEKLWLDKHTLHSGMYSLNKLSFYYLMLTSKIKSLKKKLIF